MVEWPALIKLQGDDELLFFASQQAWTNSDEAQHGFFTDDDRLIDSQGDVFRFLLTPERRVGLHKTGEYVSKDELIALVKAHMSLIKACCVSKFYADTVSEAILAVQQVQGRLKSSPRL